MTTYYVGFSHKLHLFARAIMWLTQSEFSHTYIVQEGPQGTYVLEAGHRGVNLQWWPVFLAEGALGVTHFKVDKDVAELTHAWDEICTKRLNRPYSWTQILGDAVHIVVKKLTGTDIPNPFGQRRADVCSETVLAWLRAANIEGFSHLAEDTVTPEDIVRVTRESPVFTGPSGYTS